MRFLVLLGLMSLFAESQGAEPLRGLPANDTTRAIAWGEVLLEERDIRVVTVPVVIGECWGTLASCPDIDLFISYSTGDLYEGPIVYKLAPAKEWRFVGWVGPNTLQLETALPEANIEAAERKGWQKITYHVTVSESGATVERM